MKKEKRTKKVLIFDFDGVLTHSFEPAYEVSRIFYPNLKIREYKSLFEGNILITRKKGAPDPCDFDSKLIKKIEEYLPRLYIEKVTTQLSKKYTLVIVSSTWDKIIIKFLEKFNIADNFTMILDKKIKSKVDKFNKVFKENNVLVQECLFITDTLGDLKEANEIGLETIGILDGFHSYETLKRGNPKAVIKCLTELDTFL